MRSKVITFGKILMGTVLILVCFITAGESGEKWQGVDETVVERIAKEHGREAKESLLNTDKGDLLLFVFLLAGTIGGFAAGYYWRLLIEKKKD